MAAVNKSFELEPEAAHYENTEKTQKLTAKSTTNEAQTSRMASFFNSRTQMEKILLLVTFVLFILWIVFVILLAKETGGTNSDCNPSKETGDTKYTYSAEATRIKLVDFLKRVQTTYYEYHRYSLAWQPKETDEIVADLKERFIPYNVTPAYLKAKTDASFALLKEINSTKMDESKMKPREVKAIEQVKHYLQTVFDNPFDENFYNGDWMLGPNHFCWQAICSIAYHINAYAYYVKPKSLKELEDVLKTIMLNVETLQQYESNMRLGIRTGMVRSKFTCQSGLDAFKQEFKKISKNNDADEVLKEWFVQNFVEEEFTKALTNESRKKWLSKRGESVAESINKTLIEGFGKPIVDLINYLQNDHLKHCLPLDHASGIARLPIDYIYLDGKKTKRSTKRLPITNQLLDGRISYKSILRYFTTSDISPERINEIGQQRLDALYPQVVEIAKNITDDSNETSAVATFRQMLKLQKNFYNNATFPEIESNTTAHKLCVDAESAKKHCPRRWEAMMLWADICRQTMGMLAPKLIPLFYHTGKKITVPNCPIEMLPSFNPSSGAQFFMGAGSTCTKPAYFGLPFFLENFGPRFSEWSVTAHEGWPGHHTQVQAQAEYFRDKYGGLPKWLDDRTYYTFFTEGWGLYSENPVIAQDTDTYKNNLWQKFGMLKWQVWRALRLIVDTGLHYRGMNRTTALGYFSKYAWDDTDLAQKEITRYMGVPGQATAYMLGQQKLVQLRNYAKTKLGKNFTVQDYHYQVLSQGSAPEAYLEKHVEKYVKCTLGQLKGEQCDVILKVSKKSPGSSVKTPKDEPPKPPKRHYC